MIGALGSRKGSRWGSTLSDVSRTTVEGRMEAPEAMDVQKKLDMSLDDLVKMRKKTPKAPREGSDAGKKRKGEETSVLVARRVYVGNLSYRTTWQDLKDYFKRVGNVVHTDVIRGPGDRSKGCGIVEFETPEDAAAAILKLNETELDGRAIFVREDREDRDLKEALGKGKDEGMDARASKKSRNAPPAGEHVAAIGRRLFVSNLTWDTTWQELKDHFKPAGKVVHTDILMVGERSKGCGIVEFESPQEALRAISTLSNTELKGRQILVREDREDKSVKETGQGNKGTAGRQVVVHGLPFSYTWQDLKDLFSAQGKVLRADIVMDRNGRSKGYGTVLFDKGEDAQRAIEGMDEATLEGRVLGVKLDKFT